MEEIETVLCFCTKQREEKRENERRSERTGEGADGRQEEKCRRIWRGVGVRRKEKLKHTVWCYLTSLAFTIY